MSQETTNPFGNARPTTTTRLEALSRGGDVIVVTRAYGPNGEDLMDQDGARFSGETGIRLRVRQGGLEDDVILSPYFGDCSKRHSIEFVDGVSCELLVPGSEVSLDRIPEMGSDDGGRYFAIYLTDQLADGELVAINDIWGNHNSKILGESDLLRLYADESENKG
jgi:hypothetical protein